MPNGRQKRARLTDELFQRVNSYAVAAGAAGMGLMVCTAPANAEIVFTPAHVSIASDTSYSIDLDSDGITDFTLINNRVNSLAFAHLSVQGPFNSVVVGLSDSAGALTTGAKIGSGRRFFGCGSCTRYGLNLVAVNSSSAFGNWDNVTNRFLGLKFQINGQTHYGWARLSVRVNSSALTISARLTGYAYETTADKAIRAGQTKSTESTIGENRPFVDPAATNFLPAAVRRNGSLGFLALGAQGLVARRLEN